MAQLLADVRDGSEYEVVTSITVCHVSFSLDPAGLDQLMGKTLPASVMQALNEDTAGRLTPAAAHSEVAAIEAYVHSDPAGLAPLPELAKLNAEFEAQRTSLAQVTAKGEFETETDYQDRIRKSQTQIRILEGTHKIQVASYYAPFTNRVRFLKSRIYPIAGESVYVSYDADRQQLLVRINGEEYLFWGVEADTARNLKENWRSVQARQKYDDDGSRFLFSSVGPSRLLGQKVQAVEAQTSSGLWLDSQSELMWTNRLSAGSPMAFEAALRYCHAVRTGGFSDWSLPTVAQLGSVVASQRRGGIKDGIALNGVPTSSAPGTLRPASILVWSANDSRFTFPEGKPLPTGPSNPFLGPSPVFAPALCVRHAN